MRFLSQNECIDVFFSLGIIFYFISAFFFYDRHCEFLYLRIGFLHGYDFFFFFAIKIVNRFFTDASHCQGGVTVKVLREHSQSHHVWLFFIPLNLFNFFEVPFGKYWAHKKKWAVELRRRRRCTVWWSVKLELPIWWILVGFFFGERQR